MAAQVRGHYDPTEQLPFILFQMAIYKTPTIVNCHLSIVNSAKTGDADGSVPSLHTLNSEPRTSNACPYIL